MLVGVTGARVIVVGGSIAGLATALALARHGVDVEILERDLPVDPVVDGPMHGWWRRGTPQARHSHACLARARQLLRARAPQVLTALLREGAREVPSGGRQSPQGEWMPACEDAELVGLACRRPLLESVLRRCVRDEARVTFRERIEVTGLLTTGTGIPRVIGVSTSAGPLRADLVIDASGRASGLLGWLREARVRPPDESGGLCGIVYFTRFYRLRDRPAVPLNRGVASGGVGPTSLGIAVPGDHDSLSVTMGIPPGDPALRLVRRDSAFTAVARLHPFVGQWLEGGGAEPISDVATMAGLENRLRRFVVDGRPIVRGLLPVGDAVCITDPSFARGMSLALTHAFALADVVAAARDDHDGLALAADALTTELLQPWFDDAVTQDRARTAQWSGGVPPTAAVPGASMGDVMAAAPHDARVWRAAMRRFNLLDEPGALFADETVLDAVRTVVADLPPPAAASGPTRAQILRAAQERSAFVPAS
jgi:2-polyprenyl-6-methoxyphenol hydroxylase-like FAD-dependent oxidoreductase